MSNPLLEMVEKAGDSSYQVLGGKLKGIVSNTTFYKLLDKDGIPEKTQWETIVKVSKALGYKIIFEEDND